VRLLVLLLLALLPLAAPAQQAEPQAALVADALVVTEDGRLVAEGNVQAFYQGTVVSARRVTYDRDAERLEIEGPILLRRPDGTVVAAERADLDPRLENGLLRGARLVLDRRLQLAANRIDRVGGRTTTLTQGVISSCQVCPGVAPLWELRAERVVHDELREVLHVENATFRLRGVPILWLPRARLPAPPNTRETGLLVPSIRTSDQLGVGVRLPVFVELGPSRDLLLAPTLSPFTTTLDLRYRQALLSGDLLVEGAASRDDLGEGDGTRGYLAVAGEFGLPRDLRLSFEGIAVSDDAYLADYGISDLDRLESSLTVSRVEEDSLLLLGLSAFRSLREGESGRSLPPVVAGLSWDRRLDAGDGTLDLRASADGFRRTVDGQGDVARDVARAGLSADWRRSLVAGPGLLVEGQGRLAVDAFRVTEDPDSPDAILRAAPAAVVTLRWPLVRRGPGDPFSELDGGAADLVEPVLSLGWAEALGDEPPNEDARLVELDGGNLYALSRLPGEDRVETGARLAAGLSWTRAGAGYASTLALGRVVRTEALDVPESSGLAGRASDTLVAGQIALAGGLSVNARTLLSGPARGLSVGKTEARLDWSGAAVQLGAAYLFLPADPDEDREETAAEWAVNGAVEATERWRLGFDARYDVGRDQPARAGLSVGWRNECVEVDVSVARRYTSTEDVEPSTSFGLSVNLIGFSARGLSGGEAVRLGACRG
jgi:LPS-assembly protein